MFKTFTDQNWGDVKCTLDSNGTLTINTKKLKDVIIDASSNNTDYKVPWTDNRININSVIIQGHISFSKGSNLSWLFYNFQNCESFNGLENLDVSEVTNMEGMFYIDEYNQVLKTLNLFSWKTSNVTDMNRMFTRCKGLTSLDLSNFDTSKVTNMSYMFSGCYGLTSLDLSNWNVSEVTNMAGMFEMYEYNRSLKSLNLSNWDTSNVTNMSFMFYNCCNLILLDLNSFSLKGILLKLHVNQMLQLMDRLETIVTPYQFDINGLFQNEFKTRFNGKFKECDTGKH